MADIIACMEACGWSEVELLMNDASKHEIYYADEKGHGLLHWACFLRAPISIIERLLGNGLNPNAVGSHGEISCVHVAAASSVDPRIMELLLDRGGDINVRDDENSTPLSFAISHKSSLKLVKIMLDRGANPNIPNKIGNTSVHIAVQCNPDPKLMELLLEYGGNPNIQNGDDETPVYVAASLNVNPKLMHLLLKHGGDPNKPDSENFNALTIAAQKNVNPKLVELLLKAGGDPNALDKLVKALLEFGADPNLPTDSGESSLSLARHMVRTNLIPLLENAERKALTTSGAGTPMGPSQSDAKKKRVTTSNTTSGTSTVTSEPDAKKLRAPSSTDVAVQQEAPKPRGIFISCAQCDSKCAASLLVNYAKNRFPGVTVYNDVKVECKLEELVEQVKQSSLFIILMSEQYFRRPHTLVELHAALQPTAGRRTVVHARVAKQGAVTLDLARVADHFESGRVMDYFDKKGWSVLSKFGICLEELDNLMCYLVNGKPLPMNVSESDSVLKQMMDEIFEGYDYEK